MFLRTSQGGFVNLARVDRLTPKRTAEGEIESWQAVIEGKAISLDSWYCAAGRIEKAIGFLPPEADRRRP